MNLIDKFSKQGDKIYIKKQYPSCIKFWKECVSSDHCSRPDGPLVTRAEVDHAKPNLAAAAAAKEQLTAGDTSNSTSGPDDAAGAAQRGGPNGAAAAAGPVLGNGGSAHGGHPEYGGPRGGQSQVRNTFSLFSCQQIFCHGLI